MGSTESMDHDRQLDPLNASNGLRTSTRTLPEVRDRLQQWFQTVLGDGVQITDITTPSSAGFSSDTYLVTCAAEAGAGSYVVRLPPPADAFALFPTYDLDRQVRAMRLVEERTSVPVPAVPWFERDDSFLGSEFFVMRRSPGRAVPDDPPYTFAGWLLEASAQDVVTVEQGCVDVLAGIHAIADREALAPFRNTATTGSALRQHVDHHVAHYDWAVRAARPVELIERGFDWLNSHWPSEGPDVLSWGDARPANILWDDVAPAAVLDWESVSVAPAEVDLGWMLFFHRMFQDIAERNGAPGLPDFMVRDDIVGRYEAAAGTPVRDLDWYLTYAAVRQAVVSMRVVGRRAHFGEQTLPDDPNDMVFHRQLLERALRDPATTWR